MATRRRAPPIARADATGNAAARAPNRGDLVWLEFANSLESLGHEQSGRRPALVLSPRAYNARTGLAMVCPISSKVKGYPFEVILPEDVPVQGVVLSDQLRTVDWRERRARRVCRLSDQVVEEVRRRVATLV